MPTGYTDKIKDGITFRQYALSCARAFCACFHQRDDDADVLPKKREINNYHSNEILKIEKELKRISNLSEKEADKEILKEYHKELESINDYILKEQELLEKYNKMKDSVKKWIPPTKDFIELKKFMISQIDQSITFDCNIGYFQDKLKELKIISCFDWKKEKTRKLSNDLAYHKKEHYDEIERIKSNNDWIDKLYRSLPK